VSVFGNISLKMQCKDDIFSHVSFHRYSINQMSGQKVQPTNFAALLSVKLDGQLKRVTYLFGRSDTSQLDQ